MRTRRTALFLTLFFLLGIFAARLPSSVAQLTGKYDFFDPIIETYSLIDQAYVDAPDRAAMQMGAISGMLAALDDPYTQYIPAKERDQFQKDMTGQYAGIGAEVTMEAGWLTIVTPLEDSPALSAGIKPGDRVIEIDGKPTQGESVDESVSRLTGKAGEPVTIVIERGPIGSGERLTKTITRRQITARAVKGVRRDAASGHWSFLLDEERRIGYIRLTQFTPSAPREFLEALAELRADRPKAEGGLGGLILDLRGDPGGVLDAALAVTDLFLKEGTIVSVRGRTAGEEVYRAKSGGTLPDFPLLVLVNGASASASEIVAGALSDNGRAVILGTRTFGKGLVQAVQTLRKGDGAQLKFTSQRYYLPSGRLIQRTDTSDVWGVDPTPGFYVPVTDEEQILRMRTRNERDVFATESVNNGPGAWADPVWLEGTLKDRQLALAVGAVRGRIETGEWAPVSDEKAQPARVSAAELQRLEQGRERLLRELEGMEKRIGALETAAAGDIERRAPSLWPDEANAALPGGKLEVYDRDGKLVATLGIRGQNLRRWLMDADLEVKGAAREPSGENGAGTK